MIFNTGTELYSQFIHLSRYSRWNSDEGRRETWDETVSRYVNFFCNRYPEFETEIQELKSYITDLKVMPSMRCLYAAGKALDRDEVAGYNCSFAAISHPRAFDEILYLLMCGCGVGFSVERQFINKLPEVAEEFYESDTVINVADSKIGWASSFRELISLLYSGKIPKWDLSKLRPAGARLKTFGGRSSGPEPLNGLFKFTIDLFTRAKGRKLTSMECHDLICKIADIVVAGGVRRSALISFSNPSDDRMRTAKSGQWWIENPQRAYANNSACYTEKPDFEVFLKEWHSLYSSKSGERGFFTTNAVKDKFNSIDREYREDIRTNPCSEILLRDAQLCNLSEVVIRENDTIEDLKKKVEVATIFGTLQSTLTNFRYLRKVWKNNCEEERLLGVSLSGIMDHPVLSDTDNAELPNLLSCLREHARSVNKEWAEKLQINSSAAITCVKPSGTVSQLVNSASGIHPRFSKYYIRRVRVDDKDPIAKFLEDQGFPCEVDIINNKVKVFEFPIESPKSAKVVSDVDALLQLKLWKVYQDFWTDHKPSCTIYYNNDNFLKVGDWLWNNFNQVSGISFLPYSDHTYQQAPYEEIDKATYAELKAKLPESIDWDKLCEYEFEDNTRSGKTFACVGNACEIVDLIE